MKKVTLLITFIFVVSFLMFSGSLEARLPDLTIIKITVDRNCHLAVVVKNNGPGMLPDYVYTKHHPKSAGVYVYINGKGWGGQSIWKFDPKRNLQKPGGMATYISRYRVGVTPIEVKAVVDLHNDVKEQNEANNSMIRKELRCKPYAKRLPDLTVTDIRLIKDCKIQVTIKNIGTAGVPASYYELPNAVGVQMYKGTDPWGGMILKMFDPAGKLKVPGGSATHIWFPGAANLKLDPGIHTIKVIVDHLKNLVELNEGNNSLTRRLKCSPGKAYKPCGIRLTSLSKTSGYPGDTFKMYGTWGATQGTKIPCINKGKMNKLIVLSWSNTVLNVKIPAGLEPGKYRVGVYCNDLSLGGSYSSGWKDFTILKGTGPVVRTPKRFFLDFVDAYLVYEHGKKVLQIATEKNVLSYGGDWQRAKIYDYLYDLREKFWKGFYWRVNTSRKEVYRYHGPNFGKIGDKKHEKLTNIKVDVVGNAMKPTRFFLRFKKAYLVYVPSSKTLQIVAMGNTQGNVLSYGSDWQKCNMYSYLYHLRQNVWKGFYWKINTSKKKAYRVKGGTFCALGGTEETLKMGVRVVY